jgi:hypothetical protein
VVDEPKPNTPTSRSGPQELAEIESVLEQHHRWVAAGRPPLSCAFYSLATSANTSLSSTPPYTSSHATNMFVAYIPSSSPLSNQDRSENWVTRLLSSLPLEEYRLLRLTHDWHHSHGRVRTSPHDFLAVSGLSDEDQRLLRDRYGLAAGQP